jgi:hypothetical protein
VRRTGFAAIILLVKGVQQVAAEHRGASLGDLFSNSIFRDIFLSLSMTIGLCVVASIIRHVRGARLKILMDVDHYGLLDGPVVHDHVVRAVYTPCALLYQHSERLRCELHPFLTQ